MGTLRQVLHQTHRLAVPWNLRLRKTRLGNLTATWKKSNGHMEDVNLLPYRGSRTAGHRFETPKVWRYDLLIVR
jgi:hypothetical protein